MLRNKLLATTFLIIVGSFSFSPPRAAILSGDPSGGIATAAVDSEESRAAALQTRTDFGNHSRDRNREFLCTYGYKVYYGAYYGEGSSFEDWARYAVPIRGKGASVSEIVVTDSPSAGSSKFRVGIYEDRKGKPGTRIAAGSGRAQGSCVLTTVVIPKTFLAAGKQYWIEERASRRSPSDPFFNAVEWGYKSTAKHNALSILLVRVRVCLSFRLAPRIGTCPFCESEIRQQ
jgi:hypothetical protein